MNDSERLAREYLLYLGFKSVIYEPNGNIPPDFLADDKIAVEVRRLNQNEPTASGFRGLEETSIPLQMKISKLLIELGPATADESWFVTYRVERPIPAWNLLKPALCQCLQTFRDSPRNNRSATTITIDTTFELKLLRASDRHPTFFVLGGYSDNDTGGWILGEIQKNLRLCVEEKTQKIAAVRNKYSEWWLILEDRIGYGVDACDRALFCKSLRFEHGWDKLILLIPFDHRAAFEI